MSRCEERAVGAADETLDLGSSERSASSSPRCCVGRVLRHHGRLCGSVTWDLGLGTCEQGATVQAKSFRPGATHRRSTLSTMVSVGLETRVLAGRRKDGEEAGRRRH